MTVVPKKMTKKEEIVEVAFQAWFAGKFNMEGKEKVFDEHFTEDCTFESANTFTVLAAAQCWPNVKGKEEILAFFQNTGPAPPALVNMENFQRHFFKELDDGLVHIKTTSVITCHATGKYCTYAGYMEYTVDEATGKISSVLSTHRDPESVEAIFELTKKEAIVNAVFKAWGNGEFNLEGKEKAFAEHFTDDVSFLQSYKFGAAAKCFHDTKGQKECLDSLQNMGPAPPALHNLEGLKRIFLKELDDGIVYIKFSATSTCHATGKKAFGVLYLEYTVDEKARKVSSVLLTMQDPASFDAIFE